MKYALTLMLMIGLAAFPAFAADDKPDKPITAGTAEPADPTVTLDASSLTRALDSPNKQVRYHAAAALVGIKPAMPFENSQKVIPLLSQALSERGARVALIASEDIQTINILMKELVSRGYIVDIAESETKAINTGLSAPLKDVLFVDEKMTTAFKLFQRDYRTSGQAKVVITTEGNVENLRQGLRGVAAGFITTPVDSNSVKTALDQVLKNLPTPPAKSLAAEFNLLSATALASVCPQSAAGFKLADATPALINALKLPDAVKLPSMKALANVAAIEAVPALSLIARAGGGSAKARVAAIGTIDTICRKAGAMDPRAKALMDLLLLDSDKNVRNAAAIALGANDPVDSALKRLIDNPTVIIDKSINK